MSEITQICSGCKGRGIVLANPYGNDPEAADSISEQRDGKGYCRPNESE